MNRRVLLLILDGWGIAPAGPGNAISLANTPNFDLFWTKYPHLMLSASGEDVGLPAGQIGNSEVGHLNIGAGRVLYQDLPRISKAIKSGEFFQNIALKNAFLAAKKNKKRVHLLGLVSPGGVHSHQKHLYALLEMAKALGVHDVKIHAFTDGRDVSPKSAEIYIKELEKEILEIGVGEIATISGRYFAMDRDNRWDRVSRAYNALVLGQGDIASSSAEAVANSYKRGVTDEFIRPTVVSEDGMIEDGDSVIFFNFRSDRPRELSRALIDKKFAEFKRDKILSNLHFVTMSEYDKNLAVTAVAFEQIEVKNCLAEVLAQHEIKQFHIAETEKYAHVTFFFNGGNEVPYKGEDRLMIPSPKVATYDLKPQMSAEQIAFSVTERLGTDDFIVVNFANLDMVGHTGDIEATIKAVETVDACIGGVIIAAKNAGYDTLITADHGNAEKMLNQDGTPCTSHTTNPVPFIYVGEKDQKIKYKIEPRLANIAPTVLDLLDIERPKEMTDNSLLRDN